MRTNLAAKTIAALLLTAMLPPALATFHFIKVVEVFPGTAVAPNAQYIVIQMYASGQELVSGHSIVVFNGAGTAVGTFTFPGNVANGANQAKILIATTEAQSFFGVTADLTMSPALLAAGGKVCWAGAVDCVAWGAYTGSTSGVGTPFNASEGLRFGRAAVRRLNIAGSSTVLDAGDDTDSSANDFLFGFPTPRNNAGMLGTPPSATCGNNVLEGLEQCDDGNLKNGDRCSSTCEVEASIGRTRRDYYGDGDYNGDGKSDVIWRNNGTGSNAIWRSANSAAYQPMTGVSNIAWHVVGIGDFNGDGKDDVAWRNGSTGTNAIWRSANSADYQAVSGVSNLHWDVAGVGDFNGDGKDDVLWRNDSTGANAIWRSANSATYQAMTGVNNLDWDIAGVGDFNGDGKDDVLWRNDRTGANAIWRSANSADYQAMSGVTDLAWYVAGIGDVNADGRDDVIWRNGSTGANAIWRSANSAAYQAMTGVSNLAWHVAQVGDVNGDGTDDVIWRNRGTGVNAIWLSANSAAYQAMTSVTNLAWDIVPYQGAPAAGGSPSLSISDVSQLEGDSGTTTANFVVILSKAATSAVSYNIATTDDTATAGSDYASNSLVGETIPAGSSSRAFTVTINGDRLIEPNETFKVAVSNVSGAAVTKATATGTIVNDDSGY